MPEYRRSSSNIRSRQATNRHTTNRRIKDRRRRHPMDRFVFSDDPFKRRSPALRLFLFPVVLVYLELLVRIFARNGVFKHLFYPVIFALAGGLFLAAVLSLFPRKASGKITSVLLVIIPLYYALQSFVQNAYKVYMPFDIILKGTGGVAADFTTVLIKTIIFGIPKLFLFFLPTILYFWKGKKRFAPRRLRASTAGVLIAASLFLTFFGWIFAAHGKTGGRYASEYTYNGATETFGLLTGTRLHTKYKIFGNKKAQSFSAQTTKKKKKKKNTDPNEMDIDFKKVAAKSDDERVKALCEYVEAQTPSSKNDYTGLFKGKNLIIICAEAFSDSVIDKELTPTLYRLTHKGFYFKNFYQPAWGGSTSTGEFSMVFGIIPMDNMDSIFKTAPNNNYFTPGNALQREGYYSAAYHNGSYTFYKRNITHQNLGYDTWKGFGNGMEDLTEKSSGCSDEEMFDVTMDEYIDKQPFSIYYMTIDGHAPYDDCWRTEKYMARVKEVTGKKYKKKTMNYLCYNMCLEDALTLMVDKLEEAGIADDTVIVMTGDHYPYGLEKSTSWGNSEDYLLDLYGGKDDKTPWGQDHNALILWSGCLEHDDKDMACKITDPTYSLDIAPTLLNLFGVEFDSRMFVGRDVFSDQEPLVIWNNHSWITKWGRYIGETGDFTPAKDADYTQEDIDEIKAIVNDKILFSQNVVRTDFYGVLFGKDPDGSQLDED